MSAWTLRLLGAFMLRAPSSAQPLRLGRKGQALLSYVAAHGSGGANRTRLVALLWADHGDDEARNALRQCLHQTRRVLGAAADRLHSDSDRIALRDDFGDVDIHRFEALAACSDVESLLAAAQLYQGDFVDGLDAGTDFAHWAAGERERLRDLAHGVLTRLSVVADGKDACETAVRLAQRLLANDPVHEGCYRALMHLYARAGLGAKTLQTWNECRRVLRRELDIEPSAQTAAVFERLCAASQTPPSGALRSAATTALTIVTSPSTVSSARPGDDVVVFDIMLRGWQLFSLFTADGNAQARAAFEAAIAHAGDHAQALAMLGWTHWFDSISGWSSDSLLSYQHASNCAARAISCNRGHPSPHAIQGKVLLWRMEHDAALEQLRHAVEMAPSSAYAHFNLGDATMWCGRCDEALVHLDHALRLDPNDHGVFLTIRGVTLWMMGELEEARAALTSAITRNPDYAWAHGALASVQADCGEMEAARVAAATARRLNRRFSLSFAEHVLPFRMPEHRRRQLESWRAAGMPKHERRLTADS